MRSFFNKTINNKLTHDFLQENYCKASAINIIAYKLRFFLNYNRATNSFITSLKMRRLFYCIYCLKRH